MRAALVIFVFAGLTMGCLALLGVGQDREPAHSTRAGSNAEEEIVVELCPRWERGDSRTYEIIRTTKRPGVPKPVGFRQEAHVTVTAADAAGYEFEWTYDPPRTDSFDSGENLRKAIEESSDPSLIALYELTTGLGFDIETDACGIYVGLKNWQEVADAIRAVKDAYLDRLVQPGASPEGTDLIAIEDEIFSRVTSREGIEALVGDDAGMFYIAFGDIYSSATPLVYEFYAPNPFGGDPLPGTAEFFLEAYDEVFDCGVVVVDSSYDTDEVRRSLAGSFTDIAESAGQPTPPLDAFDVPFAFNDNIQFEFCQDTGWLESVLLTRTVSSGGETATRMVEMIDISD
jgi:hypothetical protein